MDARHAGLALTLALLAGCGASRSEEGTDATPSVEEGTTSATCRVHVVNRTPYGLMLRQYVPGVRGSVPVGNVERDGELRFSTRCGHGTVRIAGYRPADEGQDNAAFGSARLTEGEVTRVVLERLSRYSEGPGSDGAGGR